MKSSGTITKSPIKMGKYKTGNKIINVSIPLIKSIDSKIGKLYRKKELG